MSGGKISIAHATLCSAKRSDQRNEKHRRAIMPRVEVSGIANLAQNSNQNFHQWPSESGSHPKNPFLRSTQYPYIHMRFPCARAGEGAGGGALAASGDLSGSSTPAGRAPPPPLHVTTGRREASAERGYSRPHGVVSILNHFRLYFFTEPSAKAAASAPSNFSVRSLSDLRMPMPAPTPKSPPVNCGPTN